MQDLNRGKEAAARYAAALVEDGMVVGLGTGSTAALFVSALGARVRDGLCIVGVPTSEATERLARAQGIALITLEDRAAVDLDVDGADAVDPYLNLLKGLGGALLREKIVAAAAARFAVIADESKIMSSLAAAPLVPVEVIPFGWSRTALALERLGARVARRQRLDEPNAPVVTDGGHYILDCHFDDLSDPMTTAGRIKALTGVVEHGLFIGLATEAIVGAADGSVRVLRS